ncbi:uncharacterized protein K444DRAFT_619940 [Hyaloscypha bicolor E]|uniref:Uncharacterized protein n=1 Tax=Hyaloscypha bicolor E TaxID=1095630 RepID=A0A2J6SP28_9HELO|nr:uncharacterized protein K444DRAFT_619940 [Hyaloscypha bicolor E]PMD52483.1 hypothetical protein K444DRAFT_619940 [Hyaloscypha bicolor E]
MASKCWFVLKQTHYPPPAIPKNGIGHVSGSGPICLGHLIPDLQHLDNVINRHGPLDVPPDMPIYPTKARELTFEINKTQGVEFSANTGVPIAAAAGLTIKLDAGLAFKQTVRNFWEFTSLDTFIFQPTGAYVEDSIEDNETRAYLAKLGLFQSSSIFMITGIIVARGAKSKTSEVRTRDVHSGPGVDFLGVASAGLDAKILNETEVKTNAQITTDFIWAIRLAKISKGLLDRRWSYETFSTGSIFGVDTGEDEGQEIADALKCEGLQIEKVDISSEGDVFVVPG